MGSMRSGSSLVARALHEWGVYLTDTPGLYDDNNPEGEYENLDFTELNELLLKDWGGNWFNPVEVPSGREKECKDLVEKYRASLWGWKDNRTAFTFKCYEKFLGKEDILFFVVNRQHESIAHSIYSSLRDQIPESKQSFEDILDLVKKYYSQIDKITKGYNRFDIHYEDFIKNPFYNSKLKHF